MKRNRRKWRYIHILCVVGLLTGCADNSAYDDAPQVTIAEYQKDIYQTTTVQSGTIEPKLTLTLWPDEYEVKTYSIKQDFLEVAEKHVEEGARVEAGDVMVTFVNEGLQEEIEEYEKRKTENQLLIDHYTRLQKIDEKQDYSKDIKKLKADIAVVDAYIAEKKAQLTNYQIVAEKAGMVTEISTQLNQGFATNGRPLVKVVSGSSNYIASTSDNYEFKVGDVYSATFNVASYELKVLAVSQSDEKQEITFEPVSDMTGVTEMDELTMEIAKTPIKDAIYVEEDAIVSIGEKNYVFSLDEQGYRHAIPVTVKEIIEGYAIISEGLEAGAQVTLN